MPTIMALDVPTGISSLSELISTIMLVEAILIVSSGMWGVRLKV